VKPVSAFFLIIGLLTLPARQAAAQVDFSGTWTLDREMSADLSKATFEPQQTQTRRTSGFGGGFAGRGFGGRNGGSRPAPGDNTTRNGESPLTATISPTRELVFTYILVPATKQMALRITLEDSGRQRADVPELRLVYRLTH
jgi:hypothetical protein